MGTLLRRLRGAIGTALTWGVGWFVLSTAFWTATLWGQVPFGMIVGVASGVGAGGALAGAAFATIVGFAERRRTFEELSYVRLAVWGALGGALMGIPFLNEVGFASATEYFGLLGLFGAGSATGMLALARQAGSDQLERPSSPDALGPGG